MLWSILGMPNNFIIVYNIIYILLAEQPGFVCVDLAESIDKHFVTLVIIQKQWISKIHPL